MNSGFPSGCILRDINTKRYLMRLNQKIGTVKSRIFFTRQKLMKILKDYDN